MEVENQKKLQGIILDFLYRAICQKKTNQQIFALMESKSMPPLNEDQLNKLRQEFQEKEQRFPEKMALFRQRLKV